MLRNHRQGWRLLIVLSRLVVAGLVTTGLCFVPEQSPLWAQNDPGSPPKPPPPTRPPRRPPDPSAAESPPDSQTPPPAIAPLVGPTLAQPLVAEDSTPTLVTLPPALERHMARRNSLNQVLCKDRRHHLLLLRGDQALSAGDPEAAIENYQAISEADHDAFFWPVDAEHPLSGQSLAHHRLQALDPASRQTYERHFGGEARALLSEAIEQGDQRALLELLRHFPQTTAGREALVRELLRSVDSGRAAAALQYVRVLAADVHHWEQLLPHHRELCNQILNDAQPFDPDSPSDAHSSPPALRPRWSYSFLQSLKSPAPTDVDPDCVSVDDLSELVAESARGWFNERQQRRLPTATANQAIVVRNLLVVRDYAGVQAFQVETGESQWSFPCAGSLANTAAANLREQDRTGTVPVLNFETQFSSLGPRSKLVADSSRLYFLDDQPPQISHPPKNDEDGDRTEQPQNRLVALSLHPGVSSPMPDWTLPCATDRSLEGHLFLGPPSAVDGRLFVLSEHDSRIECIAVDAADGQVLWKQPIALVQQQIDTDVARQRIACSPVYARSTVICPTEVGVLVGVDPLTGALRWVYDHIDDEQRHSAGRWSSSTQRNFGSAELPSRTLVLGDCVIHLPLRSRLVHCISAATGEPRWTADRRDALALSAASGRGVILIGPRELTSLSPQDGTLQWRTPCPEPAGHGLLSGDDYLLPIADGRCLAISLEDGNLRTSRFGQLLHQLAEPGSESSDRGEGIIQLTSHHDSPLADQQSAQGVTGGNLTKADGAIIMASPTQVAVFPMATSRLAELESQRIDDSVPEENQLQIALLHTLVDSSEEARHCLERLLQHDSPPAVKRRASQLLRELLFAELQTAENPREILRQLSQLPGTSADHIRILVSRIETEIELGDAAQLVAALDDFLQVNEDVLIRPEGDPSFAVSARSYVADLLDDVRARRTSVAPEELASYVSSQVNEPGAAIDGDRRVMLSQLFRYWSHVANLQNELAAGWIAAGQLQRAELLLLSICERSDRVAAARAHGLLVDLYASAGHNREAAAHLLAMGSLDHGDSVPDADPEGRILGKLSPSHPIWQVVERRRIVPAASYQVNITEHLCGDDCGTALTCRSDVALEYHERIRRKFLTAADASVTIIDRGIVTADRSRSSLALINRETGQLQGELEVPSAYWQLAGGCDGYCGQLIPICGRSAHGLSLLEQRPIWSTGDEVESEHREKVKVGPIGHDYCVLQSSRRLWVIQPATGNVCWARENLPPNAGLLSNESTGIIGDDQTLTLFDADQLSYTVYRMQSGRFLRRGRLDLDPGESRRHRRAIGAHLVHVVSTDGGERLRVWDAESDTLTMDEPLFDRLYAPVPDSHEYALVSPSGELRVINIATGESLLSCPLPAQLLDQASDLSVTTDPDHYFVNLAGCQETDNDQSVAATDEVELPSRRVRGQLLAFSRSGEQRWSVAVADAALLTFPHCRVPVLVLLRRVRDPHHRQSAALQVEVLDIRSGQTLARRDELRRTRLVQCDYAHRRGQLNLIGLDSQIMIELGSSTSEMLIHAEVNPEQATLSR